MILSLQSLPAGLALATLLGAAVPAAASPVEDPLPLRVLYLGSSAESGTSKKSRAARTERFEAFEEFLGEHCATGKALDRDDFEPGMEEDFDVVVLVWGQQDIDLGAMARLESPLGPRSQWTTPTVLLGSAGLLMAGPWELPGSWG